MSFTCCTYYNRQNKLTWICGLWTGTQNPKRSVSDQWYSLYYLPVQKESKIYWLKNRNLISLKHCLCDRFLLSTKKQCMDTFAVGWHLNIMNINKIIRSFYFPSVKADKALQHISTKLFKVQLTLTLKPRPSEFEMLARTRLHVCFKLKITVSSPLLKNATNFISVLTNKLQSFSSLNMHIISKAAS